MKDTYEFQAEINQLLSLIINAFYSDSEIAVRELIANASDALDRFRFGNDTNQEEFDIKLQIDKEKNTLTIEDNGIGMTKTDLINNLGIIAKSGTKAFVEKLQNNSKVSMIGQFGVGFYASFLIANKVTVLTKHDDDIEYEWESDASGSFTITTIESPTLKRGTKICLHLKEDSEFSNSMKITEIIKKHASFITYPIKLQVERWVDKESTPDDHTPDNHTPDDSTLDDNIPDNSTPDEPSKNEKNSVPDKEAEIVIEDITNEDNTKPETNPEKVLITEWEVQNDTKPVWIKNANDVSDEEYQSFYKQFSNDWDTYLHKLHFHIEGAADIRGLLFIPKRAPTFDKERKSRIKLYVKRVFVCDLDVEFIPEWMQFAIGVIDSEDLPINISREMLQKSSTLNLIKKNISKKIYEMIESVLSNDDTAHEQTKQDFWSQYSKCIKIGIHENDKYKDKLVKLIRFNTTKATFTTFDEYISRAPEDQKDIFYLVGENEHKLKTSPFIESLTDSGKEVILFSEPIDEYLMQAMRNVEDKNLVSCAKVNSHFKKEDADFDGFLEKCKTHLEGSIQDIVLSARLEKSPCCIVSQEFGWTANMQRIMNAQALGGDQAMNSFLQPKKTLEINPSHPIVCNLKDHFLSDSFDEDSFKENLTILYNTALISSGFSIDDPEKFSTIMYSHLENNPLFNNKTCD